jgi:hypothetical protein
MLEAIFRGDCAPETLTPHWLRIAHEAMERKRAWACTYTWPTTARSLGIEEYTRLFSKYVELHPYPPAGGSFVEGRLFVEELDKWGLLPDLGRVQSLSFDLHYRIVRGKTQWRRGAKVAYRRLRNPPYLIFGIKFPLVGKTVVWKIRMSKREMRPVI